MVIFTSDSAVRDLVQQSTTLQVGAELSAAMGPMGRSANSHLQTGDWTLHTAYAYAHSQGLFAGVSLEGSVWQVRHDVNAKFYCHRNIEAIHCYTNLDHRQPNLCTNAWKWHFRNSNSWRPPPRGSPRPLSVRLPFRSTSCNFPCVVLPTTLHILVRTNTLVGYFSVSLLITIVSERSLGWYRAVALRRVWTPPWSSCITLCQKY